MRNPERPLSAIWQVAFFLELWAFIRLAGDAGFGILELVLSQVALSASCLALASEISAARRRRASRNRA